MPKYKKKSELIVLCGFIACAWIAPLGEDEEYPIELIEETENEGYSSALTAGAAGASLVLTVPLDLAPGGVLLWGIELLVFNENCKKAISCLEDSHKMRTHNLRIKDDPENRERVRNQRWLLKALNYF